MATKGFKPGELEEERKALDFPLPDADDESPPPSTPPARALGLVLQAIEALSESRSVKYAAEYEVIGGKLEWVVKELEGRL